MFIIKLSWIGICFQIYNYSYSSDSISAAPTFLKINASNFFKNNKELIKSNDLESIDYHVCLN